MRAYLSSVLLVLGLGSHLCRGDQEGLTPSREPIPAHLPYNASLTLEPPPERNRDPSLGEGFTRGTLEAGFSFANAFGLKALGTSSSHDLTFGALHFGWIFSDVVAQGHWYQGNWELLGEFFGGAQYNSRVAYLAGITPGLRYNFVTGTRFVPFVHAGAGVTLTDIGAPDLGSTFQFNLQVGAGFHYFWRENASFTLQYRFLHISNADIQDPNHGLNSHTIFVGASWFFGGGASPRANKTFTR